MGTEQLAYLGGLKPVLLWTDALVFLLVAVISAFLFYVRRHQHLRAPWRRVFASRVGMVSMVVISCYVVVGLLDSVHFREPLKQQNGNGDVYYSVEALSLLDLVLRPLKERSEKTYSAPFATHLYAKETLELPDGEIERRLREQPP
ncbi:MAG: hypothetical protein ACE5ET_11235, partial [Gammaproteobacteria bacterium]